jgi:hypothetical protein
MADKQATAREYIGLDIQEALDKIADIGKLLPHAHLGREGKLIRRLTDAASALKLAQAALDEET